jgi:hypothetical protein
VSGAQAADTTRYVCIGNSITYGYLLAKVTQAYPYLLQKMLRSTYLTTTIPVVTDTVFDFGVCSSTLLREADKPPYWAQANFYHHLFNSSLTYFGDARHQRYQIGNLAVRCKFSNRIWADA